MLLVVANSQAKNPHLLLLGLDHAQVERTLGEGRGVGTGSHTEPSDGDAPFGTLLRVTWPRGKGAVHRRRLGARSTGRSRRTTRSSDTVLASVASPTRASNSSRVKRPSPA